VSLIVKIGEISVEITATTSKLRANLAQASSLIRDFSLLSQGLGGGISEAFRQISEVGVRGLQISLLALGGSFALAAKTGAEFEDEIVRAFTILKEGGNAMVSSLYRMTDTALLLGRETLFSAVQAAQGMQVLARAGFNTKEILDSIRPTLDLAIVGNLGLAESADIVIAALRGFNLETKNAGRVADILALGSSKANTTIQELGNALSYVAPVAAGAGLSLEETAAAIGILSNAGIRGSRAGTTLRRALSQLLAPSRKAKEVMDELGVSFVNSEGKLKPFAMIINDLEKAGMNAAQAMKMFGLRAGPGMIALVNAGSGSISKLSNSLERAKGTAEDMSQAFRTTVKGRVRDLMASIVDLGLAFSENFKKPLADAIFSIRNFVVNLVNVGNRMGIFRTTIKGVKNALEPILDLVGDLANKFKNWVSELTPGKISEFFSGLRKDISAFVESLTKGEIGAIIKDTFTVIIGLGKILINTITSISEAWMGLPQGVRDSIRPIIIITALILKLFGGLLNIIFLWISLNALLASFGLKITTATLAGKVLGTVFLSLWHIVLVIGAGIAGWTLGRLIGELPIVKGYFTALAVIAGSIGPSLKLAAMSILAIQQPWRLLNKEFKAEMSATIDEMKIKAGALKEIDWLGKKDKGKDKYLDLIKGFAPGIGVVQKAGGLLSKQKKVDRKDSLTSIDERDNAEINRLTEEVMILQNKLFEESAKPSSSIVNQAIITLMQQLIEKQKSLDSAYSNLYSQVTALTRQVVKPSNDYLTKSDLGASLK